MLRKLFSYHNLQKKFSATNERALSNLLITSKFVQEYRNRWNSISKFNSVELLWPPDHYRVEGNQNSDARRGFSLSHTEITVKNRIVSRTGKLLLSKTTGNRLFLMPLDRINFPVKSHKQTA